jgi:hypothetical protein
MACLNDFQPATPVSSGAPGGDPVYLFCLARADAISGVDGAGAGVDGQRPLDIIRKQDVVAVVSAVNVDDFSGPAAEARMQDLSWIGPRACRHEEVVELVMRSSPVVPVRFATLFSSRATLLAWLETHHAGISQALDRFADHQEWAVKGALDKRQAEAPLIAAALTRNALPASAGARYLEERRIRAGIGQELNAWRKELCERIARELRGHAVEFRERAVGPQLSDDEGTPILNWAFLISSERVGEFRACVERMNAAHAEHGLAIDCCGPWPPYSFCPALDAEPCASHEAASRG